MRERDRVREIERERDRVLPRKGFSLPIESMVLILDGKSEIGAHM